MSRAGLDAVIFPPVPLPALPHGAARTLTPALTYTFLANVLHWPAGVVPVTLVQKDEEVRNEACSQRQRLLGGCHQFSVEPQSVVGGGRMRYILQMCMEYFSSCPDLQVVCSNDFAYNFPRLIFPVEHAQGAQVVCLSS